MRVLKKRELKKYKHVSYMGYHNGYHYYAVSNLNYYTECVKSVVKVNVPSYY